jgi:hypothetical protein
MPRNKPKRDDTPEGSELPGWPGYRTRPNRSGLDPIDSRAEAGHMGGTFLRRLFTFKARTRNPVYLILMFIFGVIPFLSLLVFMIGGLPGLNIDSLVPMIYLIFLILILGAVSINFLLSILEIFGVIPSQRARTPIRSKAQTRKKKLPKRPKNYR